METTTLQPNKGKELIIEVDGRRYARYPIKTHIIQPAEDLKGLIERYVLPQAQPEDMVFISEKVVAITQGRAVPIGSIKPSSLAKWAVKYVYKNPGGLGIATPWTMQTVIDEAGVLRFSLASLVGVIGKLFGVRGMFYRVIGQRAKAIDGPIPHAMPPYNECVTLSPLDPKGEAKKLAKAIEHEVVIIDANDLGVETMGRSGKVSENFARKVFRDNPLGQSREQTPLCLVRRVD
ncbi:MAG TPA: coenzyme F420-0:L-glutamate ligase [Candidatus Paceibacterota bacterium]|nr:coenzyme F420-0:L-glutamate ligase [Candidatus Paceibacterota bacterium]